MNTTKTQVPSIIIRRTLAAPRTRVYAAWTQPEQIRKWHGARDVTVLDAATDVRVGGAYRIVFQPPDGESMTVRGVYREVREPERLSYTWVWEEDSPEQEIETLVTVEFHDRGHETELVLTHEQLAGDESRANHEKGWNSGLDELGSFLAS